MGIEVRPGDSSPNPVTPVYVVALVREMLDQAPPRLTGNVLAEDIAARLQIYLSRRRPAVVEGLRQILSGKDQTAWLAVYAVGQLALVELVPDLKKFREAIADGSAILLRSGWVEDPLVSLIAREVRKESVRVSALQGIDHALDKLSSAS
jgi:hypothetical protein